MLREMPLHDKRAAQRCFSRALHGDARHMRVTLSRQPIVAARRRYAASLM